MPTSSTPKAVGPASIAPLSPPLQANQKHVDIGFNTNDIAALISAIESSQNSPSSSTYLPAEILLLILEHVPAGHVLDWRLVCRGFRDAIDGRILHHHLQRTQLVGYLGPRTLWPLQNLTNEQYDRMQFLRAEFLHVEHSGTTQEQGPNKGPVWGSTHAIFKIDYSKFGAKPGFDDAKDGYDSTIEYASTIWHNAQSRLELAGSEEGFGTLRWCTRLDYAVFDLDFPLEANRNSFNLRVNLDKGIVKVAWKELLFNFLKTERALRCLLEEKRDSRFTYNHFEDCFREVRRRRLHAALDPDSKVDRHLKWSLRLLRPLFGRPRRDPAPLELAENVAVNALLFLRREAGMSTHHIAHLHQLCKDLQTMEADMSGLEDEFHTFKAHMFPAFTFSIPLPTQMDDHIPHNPIAWPDNLRERIEGRVMKWRSQRKVMDHMRALLASSNEAMEVPEDSFDNLSSQV
ncbi:hypothetical protein IQ06DRAFT_289638 [Phaeosphaeriaceae sp. SRC1lsM3a]|nr:hypothetical protein IQ06DRAFT_289638 [Stagonospora sp. SRC1lsM3a]